MSSHTEPTTLNIPSLLAFAVISFFAIRYFFFTPVSSSNSSSRSSSSNDARRVPADRIEQVAVMFPQLSRREIEYDLSRNGASVQATTERVLREGRLPNPPANFQAQSVPPMTQPSTASSSSSSSSAGARAGAQHTPAYQDLITRYGLSSKVAAAAATAADSTGTDLSAGSAEKQKVKGGWSQNKGERQALLKKRREDMILEARRKMEEKDRLAKQGA